MTATRAHDDGSGPGAPTDALGALVSALAAARPTTPDTADPNVALAFSLGWQMGELELPPGTPDDDAAAAAAATPGLHGLGALGRTRRVEILVDQVQAGLTRLSGPLARAGFFEIEHVAGLRERCADGDARSGAVQELHTEVLGKLTAADFRLGKAYGLGVALASLCRPPTTYADIRDALRQPRVAAILRWLDDLGTALPPHAGDSVATSLRSWQTWATDPRSTAGKGDDEARLPLRWRRQGELWRALLSGEKRASEMLEIDDWLGAAREFERRIRTIGLRVVRHMPIVVGLVVALVAVGVWLLLDRQHAGWTVAGAASLLSAVGLTWKGIGGTIGKLVAKVEQPLFGAATDDAVAHAITLLSADVGDGERSSGRRMRSRVAHELPPRPGARPPGSP